MTPQKSTQPSRLAALLLGSTMALGLGLFASTTLAQETQPEKAPEKAVPVADLPAAEDVIASYVKALGGEKAIRAIKSRKMVGTLSMDGMMDPMSITILAASPNRMLVVADAADMGIFRQGFDGKTAWTIDPMQGPMVLEEDMRKQMTDQSDFAPELNYKTRYTSMTCVARKNINGKDCYAIDLVGKDKAEQTHYFDVETGLLASTKIIQEGPFGETEVLSHHKDYKEFNGVKIPTTIEVEMMNMKRLMKFETVEVNKVEPSAFDLPSEVQALLPKETPAEENDDN